MYLLTYYEWYTLNKHQKSKVFLIVKLQRELGENK